MERSTSDLSLPRIEFWSIFEQTLEEAEIKDGECLTALVLQPQLAATSRAFALWCHGDNAVVGHAEDGGAGVSSRFRPLLGPLLRFSENGSVVTLGGDAEDGGDSSAVQDQLTHIPPLLRFWQMDLAVTVRQFKVSSGVSSRFKPYFGAFAAILEDGSVVTWGRADFGGDSSAL